MSEFGNWRGGGRDHHRHHHHRQDFLPLAPWQMDGGDFGPPAPIAPMADMDDFGCDPYSPGFRVFGQDDSQDPIAPQDDDQGGQGGVMDAVAQVASGIPDAILPPAMPPPMDMASMPMPYDLPEAPFYRHRRHHHHHLPLPEALYIDPRFDPRDRRWDARAWGRLHRIDQDRYRRLWADRARHFHGEGDFGQWPGQQNFSQVSQSPNFRYGPGGYRPRGGQQHHGHSHGHQVMGHHHHQGRGGTQGWGNPANPGGAFSPCIPTALENMPPGSQQMPLPPGVYQSTCNTCNYDGQTLNCTCKDAQGNWQHSCVTTDPSGNGMGIANHNGQLVLAPY